MTEYDGIEQNRTELLIHPQLSTNYIFYSVLVDLIFA